LLRDLSPSLITKKREMLKKLSRSLTVKIWVDRNSESSGARRAANSTLRLVPHLEEKDRKYLPVD
jgi:hypothetical protein